MSISAWEEELSKLGISTSAWRDELGVGVSLSAWKGELGKAGVSISAWEEELGKLGVQTSAWRGDMGKLGVSSLLPPDPSNIVAGRSLSLSGALGSNGQMPDLLNPLLIRLGLLRQISVAWWRRPTMLYLVRTCPALLGLHCHSQANDLSCFFNEQKKVRSRGLKFKIIS